MFLEHVKIKIIININIIAGKNKSNEKQQHQHSDATIKMDQKQKQKKMILKFYVIILVRKTNMMIRSSFWLSKGYPQVISNTLPLRILTPNASVTPPKAFCISFHSLHFIFNCPTIVDLPIVNATLC